VSGWVGKKPEKKPLSSAGRQASEKGPATTLWLRGQKRNSITSPSCARITLGSKVRPSRPTDTGMVSAVARAAAARRMADGRSMVGDENECLADEEEMGLGLWMLVALTSEWAWGGF
jgi:hypothetical protein